MSGLGGERDLTAVLIGACVGSMTVLLFTIGILAFIYWCCFRERLRWWRKFENAAVVIGNPAAASAASNGVRSVSSTTRSAKGGGPLVDSSAIPLAGISTVSGSIVQLANGNYRNNNNQHDYIQHDYGPKQFTTEAVLGTGSLTDRSNVIASNANPVLISAMKGSGLSSSQMVIKRSSLNVSNPINNGGTGDRKHYKCKVGVNGQLPGTKVRPGLSLVTLPTTSTQISHLQQQQQYLSAKQQRLIAINKAAAAAAAAVPLNNGVVRRQVKSVPYQHVANKESAVRIRGVSMPCEDQTSPSDEAPGDDSQPTSSTASSFAASAKRWSSMPAITASINDISRERDYVPRAITAKRGPTNGQQTEEISTSWRSQYVHHQFDNNNVARVANNRRHNSRRQTTCIIPSSLIHNQPNQMVASSKLTDVPGSPNYDDNRKPMEQQNNKSMPPLKQSKPTEKQQVAMLMMTREAQYTFTADDDEDDESSSPEFFRKPNNKGPSPPPSVSAIVGVIPQRHLHVAANTPYAPVPSTATPTQKVQIVQQSSQQSSSGEYGSHSSRISGDDSAIVVLDSGQSTSSKNGTDAEHDRSSSSPHQADHRQSAPQPESSSANTTGEILAKPAILQKPSALKKPTTSKPPQSHQPIINSNNNSNDDDGEDDALEPPASSPVPAQLDEDQPIIDEVNAAMATSKLDDEAVSSSMRSKIAKIRRYKQRSRTTGLGNGMSNMRSLSVAELNRPAVKMTAITTSEEAPDGATANNGQQRASSRQQSTVHPRRVTGEINFTYSPASATITGHTIGVHVDNSVSGRPIVAAISPNSGMRRYATMEALTERNDASGGTYMGRMAASVVAAAAAAAAAAANNNNNNELLSSNNSETSSTTGKTTRVPIAALSSGSSTCSSSAKVQTGTGQITVISNEQNIGARLTVGGCPEVLPAIINAASTPPTIITTNGNVGIRTSISKSTASTRTSDSITSADQPPYAKIQPGANSNGNNNNNTSLYNSPHSGAYNVEQATRQHQQQLRAASNNSQRQQYSQDDEEDDDTTTYSVDQAKLVTENAFRFLNEFSEAETHSVRSVNDDTHDESSHADSELNESFRHQQYRRDVHIPPAKQPPQITQLTVPSTRSHRGSPAPKQQFKQQELRLGDWL